MSHFLASAEDGMRIGLFFDGANFYRALSAVETGLEIDYDALASWIVEQVGGEAGRLAGAWYYTGVRDQPDLERFLTGLERRTGYFVRRFAIVDRLLTCPACGEPGTHRVEKGVDVTIAVDMVRAAFAGAVDTIVLLSGDEDLRAGVEGAQEAGCPVWLATWGGQGLSNSLRAAAYGCLDLSAGLSRFSVGRAWMDGDRRDDAALVESVLRQVAAAAAYFDARGGFLSRSYFERRWDGGAAALPPGAERSRVVEQLLADGLVEQYAADHQGRMVEAIRPATRRPRE